MRHPVVACADCGDDWPCASINAYRAGLGEAAELQALFDMQRERMSEATARWRTEDPEARALIWPDLGALLQWLMDKADAEKS